MEMEPATPLHPPLDSHTQSKAYSISTPPSSSSSSATRLWKPAAQRNLRNQWSKLNSLRQDWHSSASAARSNATCTVNSYLSQRYMDGMDFGVLSDMPNIKKKACSKLLKQQEHYKGKLLVSYRDMVAIVTRMVDVCKSLRCYSRTTGNSQLTRFSFYLEEDGDSGDCNGIPVFNFHSIASFEELAWEIVKMYIAELNLKRLLVMELLSIYSDKVEDGTGLQWIDEFYDGEFNDLSVLHLYSKETRELVLPFLRQSKSGTSIGQYKSQPDSNILQVYITTWMVEVNVDRNRIDEIFAIVGADMRVDFLGTS